MGDHGGVQPAGLGPWVRARRKAIGVVIGTAAYGVQAAISDGHITGTEAGAIITGLILGVIVYVIPNDVSPDVQVTS